MMNKQMHIKVTKLKSGEWFTYRERLTQINHTNRILGIVRHIITF